MIEHPSLVSYRRSPDELLAELIATLRTDETFQLGQQPLTPGMVFRTAHAGADAWYEPPNLALDEAAPSLATNQAGIEKLQSWLQEKRVVYGVNTGFGGTGVFNKGLDDEGLCRQQEVLIDGLLVHAGGPTLPTSTVRGAMIVRVVSNLLGVSALREEVMRLLLRLLQEDVVPVVPMKGSLTASGDLVALAYIAAMMQGDHDDRVQVDWQGRRMSARQALNELGLQPIRLQPKEGLALVNGTSVAAGAGCQAVVQGLNAYYLSMVLTALANCAVRGTLQSYHPFTAEVKPHAGQVYAGRLIFNLLHSVSDQLLRKDDIRGFAPAHDFRLWQLTYPFRCATQHLAPEYDVLLGTFHDLGIEINSASDNPLILNDEHRQFIVSGGNFLGSTIARDMDKLKVSLHSIARLVHAQFKYLIRGVEHMVSATEHETIRERFIATHVIPLSAHPADNMGFQGVEIYMDALLSEMNQKVGPHSSTYLPAEMENQAIVSMGLAAARGAQDIAEDTNYCLAAHLLATCQAFDLTTLPGEVVRQHESKRINAVIENPRADELGHLKAAYDFVRTECGIPTVFTSTRMHTYLDPLVSRIERLDLLSYLFEHAIQPALADDAYERHGRQPPTE